jgi:drug/metabolite transporter superfamily protein YnfA
MTRNTLIAIGAVLVVFGGVWFLQGIDVLGGSGMSGQTKWAVIGAIIVVVGVVVVVTGARRPRR